MINKPAAAISLVLVIVEVGLSTALHLGFIGCFLGVTFAVVLYAIISGDSHGKA